MLGAFHLGNFPTLCRGVSLPRSALASGSSATRDAYVCHPFGVRDPVFQDHKLGAAVRSFCSAAAALLLSTAAAVSAAFLDAALWRHRKGRLRPVTPAASARGAPVCGLPLLLVRAPPLHHAKPLRLLSVRCRPASQRPAMVSAAISQRVAILARAASLLIPGWRSFGGSRTALCARLSGRHSGGRRHGLARLWEQERVGSRLLQPPALSCGVFLPGLLPRLLEPFIFRVHGPSPVLSCLAPPGEEPLGASVAPPLCRTKEKPLAGLLWCGCVCRCLCSGRRHLGPSGPLPSIGGPFYGRSARCFGFGSQALSYGQARSYRLGEFRQP